MKLVKSLLLGSAAGIAAVAGANAADLPSKKAAPVEYVRVCSQYGKGFFYVPGSDTCIQFSGRVRADTVVNQVYNRTSDAVGMGAQARLAADVRTNTPYGTVRAFLRYSLNRTQSYWNTSGNYVTGSNGPGNGGGLDRAYIQFAGLTAGRTQSFFDFYADNNNYAAIRTSDVATQVLAYTANFGGGWSFTAALEDGNERRMSPTNTIANYPGYQAGGQTVPDVVGALLVEQSWGSAQLSAALHQIRPTYYPTSDNSLVDTTYGYAIKGGVKFNLSMLAPGDELWLEGGYAEGAMSYIGASNYGWNPNLRINPTADAYVNGYGQVKKTKGWNIVAAMLHYWTPSIRQNVFASYMNIDYDHNAYSTVTLGNGDRYNIGFVPSNEVRVGTNLIWSPIKSFDIGVEVLYTRVDPKGRVVSNNNGAVKTVSSEDHWQGRLRIQRDF